MEKRPTLNPPSLAGTGYAVASVQHPMSHLEFGVL